MNQITNCQVINYLHPELGSIRATLIGNEPFFIGKDVAEVLGYSNPRKALIDHVDNEDKVDGVTIRDSTGREQKPTFINESGLYALILSSHLPKAKQFKRWVTSEVLPAIRKHGLYANDELLANSDLVIAALTQLKEEREKTKLLETKVLIQEQKIAELTPKSTYYGVVLNCKDAVNISVIAKDYGMSAKQLNQLLHDSGVQFRQGRMWLLYQEHAECGYTKTYKSTYRDENGEEHACVHTKWTQKGRLFIYNLLKSQGVLPVIEQGVSHA